ncbi:MAG: MATE family efflux transporter [Rhizobiales bacterium]|nr:MATE family efflux transporter [Hyphomicrobiales bacterium]
MFKNINKELWLDEFKKTYVIAWPLILTQLLHTSLSATDVLMMGWLGPKYLAAGGTASSFYFTFVVFGMGVVGAVAPLVAQAIGAKNLTAVRRSLRQGVWVALLLAMFLIIILFQAETIFVILKQSKESSALGAGYLNYASWSLFPILLMVAFRSFLSGHNDTKIILLITIIGFFLNLVGNAAFMFGQWGAPRMELEGAGLVTSFVQLISTTLVILYIIFGKKYKHYEIFVRFWRPDWDKFQEILRVGVPIGFTVMSEVGLFSAAYFLMGMLSTEETAAHAVALQIASITFMIPFGLSFATTVRVGLAYGQGSKIAIYYSAWVSIILSFVLMLFTCAAFILLPEIFVHLFLDPNLEKNVTAIGLAISYLAIAGIFQLVDGVQVTCAAALRGLSDTKTPMYIALVGYWLFGFPISYLLAFTFELRGVGVWIGLAASLAFVAVGLLIRFIYREKYIFKGNGLEILQ